MRILIIDTFLQRRDPAQTDMYVVMSKKHTLVFNNPVEHLLLQDYDLLWLGIYHQRIQLDFSQVFYLNTAPVIIDQADNEEFLKETYLYRGLKEATVLSRYKPIETAEHPDIKGFTSKVLPWFIDAKRIPELRKTADIAFICSIYGRREAIQKSLKSIGRKHKLRMVVGEYYGLEYAELLSKCRVSIVECERKCLTQKYLEGALASAILLGDKPLYPTNELEIIQADLDDILDLEKTIRLALHFVSENKPNPNRQYVLDTFANKEWWSKQLESVLG